MTRRRFGPLPDEVPTIGQGTWMLGEKTDRAAEIAALRAGIARGLTHIDTAEMYGSGLAETLVGEAIADIPRDELFIVSKVLPHHAGFEATLRACEQSLERLRIDHLDVYLLHWRGRVPLAETLAAFEQLIKEGKIRALGVSNFDIPDLEEARALLTSAPIACNQVLYNLNERHIDAGLVDHCHQHQIAVVGYSPFGHGRGAFPSLKSRAGRVLADIAERHHATPRQVALAFLARAAPLFTIPKASTTAHAEENAGALDVVLTANDIRELDAAFPTHTRDELPAI